MKKTLLILIGCLLLLSLPVLLWWISPQSRMNVVIIDKTVPDESYREHRGVMWVLNHFRYKNGNKAQFHPAEDYYGFVPDARKQRYDIRELPSDYTGVDFIYIADTSGVYAEDLPWDLTDREEGGAGPLYGGLEEWEWDAMVRRLQQPSKTLFIAEFNAFASPTNETVRNEMMDHFGIEWSGWTGRYFHELDPGKNPEIPQWIVAAFPDGWAYSGEGFILVNDLGDGVVVLEKGKHIGKSGIRLDFTEQGQKMFRLKKSPDYKDWFDISIPRDEGATVLADYEWDLTEEGKQVLSQHQIPEQFAAVFTSERGSATNYYFAGDFNDIASVPRFYQVQGLHHLFRWTQSFSDNAFYWRTYVPMMNSILRSFEPGQVADAPLEGEADKWKHPARVVGDKLEVYQRQQWVPMTVKGVNMGMAKPNHFPGEAAITEEEYERWFEMIGEMNANVIRVYTLHPPGFYRALQRYNETHNNKLYVMHGVWINEERLAETLDAYDEEILAEFQAEMKRIADVIHGNAVVEAVPGHASGIYRADISDYVIGWVIGIEWYPHMVVGTNDKYAGIGDYEGRFFYTSGASPFEVWLAEQMDVLATYEMETYRTLRPMSFTNWVTTDLLTHPAEPNKDEDLISVDPNVIYTKNEMDQVGQFASYHIYPYYPDFLNFEQSYQTYVDHRGEYNSYAAYLAELHAAHRLPILVAEFGVPASRGLTHENPFGWNQGFLTEKEQGMIIQRLFEDIMAEQMLGGLVFTWQDEWFKRTWNTMDYDNPDRRPFWSNAQTNEQQFGLLSFDRHKIAVDGSTDDWQVSPLYQREGGKLRALYVDHDERYLYIRLDTADADNGYPLILLDVVPDQGNHAVEGIGGLTFANGIDFLIRLDGDQSRVLIDPYYDLYSYMYGYHLKMLDPLPPVPTKNSGQFSTIQYVLNRELYLPQQDIVLPFSSYETGKLREGNGNPLAEDYDSLADFFVNDNGIIELRIPWLLIQSRDPSQKEFVGDLYADGLTASRFVDQIFIGALYVEKAGSAAGEGGAVDGGETMGTDGGDEAAAGGGNAAKEGNTADWVGIAHAGEIVDAFPALSGTQLGSMRGYIWDNWEMAQYEERLKQSYEIVRDLFGRYD